jgi:uncharacterized RDD family membrane protein YckC
MDRNVVVRTPESIAFRYELAGLGSRCLAVCVDLFIQIGMLLLIFWGIYYAAMRVGPSHLKTAAADENLGRSIAIAFLIFIIFTVFYGYHIVFEAFWNGQTPGKKLLGIRVVRDGGYPLDFGGAFLRNLIRIVEELFGFYLIAAISALLSPENKRLGDYAAGTIVVREGKLVRPSSLRDALAEGEKRSMGAYLSDAERAVIARFLDRRASLDLHRRFDLAAALAARFRDRAPAELRDLPDEELLERL